MKILLIALMLVLALVASATEIHQWKDADGNIHFGDRPPASAAAEIVTVKPNVYSSPQILANETGLDSQPGVVMYSAVWCGYCKKARQYFAANDIPFKEYDVEKSRKGKRDFKKLKAKGVPVILVGDQRLNGFSASSFRQIYDRAGGG